MHFNNLKKNIILLLLVFFAARFFAQDNITIDISDDVYSFLEIAEEKGYCSSLSYNKPYTKKYIVSKLNDIRAYLEENASLKFRDTELNTVNFYLSRYYEKDGIDWNRLAYRYADNNEKFPISFELNNTDELIISSGVYTDSSFNSTGFELFHNLNILGNLGKKVSYRCTGFAGAVYMPLEQVGSDYLIGHWWYDDWRFYPDYDEINPDAVDRTINTFRNNSFLPYSYKKKWDGSVYYFSNVSSSGLEGWPTESALAFGMYGELRGNIADDKITIGISRVNREWGGMDSNSSLVYNYMASPFVAFDVGVNLFKWLSFQTLTGVLEFPNASYINENAWYRFNYDSSTNSITVDESIKKFYDAYFFQNAYSIGMFNLNFKYVHFDFGSTVIWPKRFEIGYMFPLVDKVIYQNYIGDYDNLALFADLKGQIPSIGSVWGSVYLEEMNSLNAKLFLKTRCMFAYQGGIKANLPFLPYTTITARYTKVEPYCYTHQAIRKQPWYAEYVNEPYANNGHSIGYYLEPNSDELFVRIDSRPVAAAAIGLQYQMIRHGADFGYAQVPGSSIWSELPIGDRNIYYKYFLHDGAYEWTHIIKLDASYNFKGLKLPFQVTGSVGYVYDYFTVSEVYGAADNDYFANQSTPYHRIEDDTYSGKSGFVFTIAVKVFAFDTCQ